MNKDFELVKTLLKESTEIVPYNIQFGNREINTTTTQVTPIPILHNKGRIFLQFCGWSINLYEDSIWMWEDTTGG